mgnify:CR=1 FL=1
MSDSLFDMDSVRMDSPRLVLLKAYDIQTHHAPQMPEDPWIAIPMNAARKRLKGYDPKPEEVDSIASITLNFCRLLDDSGMIFYGDSETEVQDAALQWCAVHDQP